jgi:hypothetical protein
MATDGVEDFAVDAERGATRIRRPHEILAFRAPKRFLEGC